MGDDLGGIAAQALFAQRVAPWVLDRVSELEHYTGARQRLLLSMRPGLTGAWAVSGRHAVGYPERCELELGYVVRRWSLRGDVRVLLRTIRALASY